MSREIIAQFRARAAFFCQQAQQWISRASVKARVFLGVVSGRGRAESNYLPDSALPLISHRTRRSARKRLMASINQ